MSSHFPDFERFVDELIRLRGRIRTLYGDFRAGLGLNEMELTVLTAVANAATPPTVAQIGRSLGHPRQVVQRAANRLVELGYIAFADNPDHKRASLLTVTPAGAEIKEEDRRITSGITAALHRHVDSTRFQTAAEQLHAIRLDMDRYLRESGDE